MIDTISLAIGEKKSSLTGKSLKVYEGSMVKFCITLFLFFIDQPSTLFNRSSSHIEELPRGKFNILAIFSWKIKNTFLKTLA
jgi:hypothetical protein